MKFIPEFKQMLSQQEWQGKYIGEGNPNADILIVGQECAIDPFNQEPISKCVNVFFLNNFNLWQNNVNNEKKLSYASIEPWTGQPDLVPDRYNPFLPYKGQTFSCRKIDGTSRTWYNYQKVINYSATDDNNIVVAERYQPLTFLKNCFITELNDFCIPNHHLSKEQIKLFESLSGESLSKTIEHHIGARYDLIKNHDREFFKHFKVVLMATGKEYIKKLDVKSMFGDAHIIYVAQASRWKEEMFECVGKEISKFIKA